MRSGDHAVPSSPPWASGPARASRAAGARRPRVDDVREPAHGLLTAACALHRRPLRAQPGHQRGADRHRRRAGDWKGNRRLDADDPAPHPSPRQPQARSRTWWFFSSSWWPPSAARSRRSAIRRCSSGYLGVDLWTARHISRGRRCGRGAAGGRYASTIWDRRGRQAVDPTPDERQLRHRGERELPVLLGDHRAHADQRVRKGARPTVGMQVELMIVATSLLAPRVIVSLAVTLRDVRESNQFSSAPIWVAKVFVSDLVTMSRWCRCSGPATPARWPAWSRAVTGQRRPALPATYFWFTACCRRCSTTRPRTSSSLAGGDPLGLLATLRRRCWRRSLPALCSWAPTPTSATRRIHGQGDRRGPRRRMPQLRRLHGVVVSYW